MGASLSESVFNYGAVYRPQLNRDRCLHLYCPIREDAEALCMLFRLEGFIVIPHDDIETLRFTIRNTRTDVIVLDCDNPALLDVLVEAKTIRRGIASFVIVPTGDVDTAIEAVRAGASDVTARPINAERLMRGIREHLKRYISVNKGEFGGEIVVGDLTVLTPREREVLELIANGKSNKEAADILAISPRTVEVHRARVMEKLGARNTADLVRIVLTL